MLILKSHSIFVENMAPKLIFPTIFQHFASLSAVETTRQGGVSPAPFNSLNLGNFTDDLTENILENRRIVLTQLGFDLSKFTYVKQTHDDKILVTEKSEIQEGYDAIITNKKDLMIGVTVADCTPILIYDAENQVIAAIHAGWKGTVLQIVRKTLEKMQTHHNTNANHCFAYIGTCIDECDFEVGDEVATHFSEQHKVFYEKKQKYHVNLKKANEAQLLAFGIPKTQIEISPRSTASDIENYFSHRAEKGQTGRMMALIGMIGNE